MTAPIRVYRHRYSDWWVYLCRLCWRSVWTSDTSTQPAVLRLALAHLAEEHRRPLPSGMAEPEPGCTCDPYGAAQCHDHTMKGTES